jgi:hypothetical protein
VLDRLDALLTRERVRNYSLIFLVLGLAALVANASLGHYPVSWSGQVVLPDYLAHWTGGRMLLEGRLGELYDPAAQAARQQAAVPGPTGLSWFVSPPVAVAPYAVLALLPYGASAVLWTLLTAGLLGLAVALGRGWVAPEHRRDYGVLVLVFLGSSAVLELVGSGQDSAAALVVLLLGLRLLGSGRAVAAGLVLALGVFKPQLFAFVPLVLLLQQRYRALAAFVGGSVALVLLSLPLVGLGAWRSWLGALASPLYQGQVQVGQTWKMQSVSALATALGAPGWTAYAVFVLGALVLVVLLRGTPAPPAEVWALAVLSTVVFSPHVMQYDLVMLLPVLVVALPYAGRRALRLLALLTGVTLYTVAFRNLGQGGGWAVLGAPWSALALFAVWLLAVRERVGVSRPRWTGRLSPAGRGPRRRPAADRTG